MAKLTDYEFANLNNIELEKIKEVEELINRKIRVNSGREIYLMAFTPKDMNPNESGLNKLYDQEPTYHL